MRLLVCTLVKAFRHGGVLFLVIFVLHQNNRSQMEPRITVKEKAKQTQQEKKSVEKKSVEKKLTAEDIAESIKRGFAEVKLIQEGKIKPKTLKEFLNEL